MADSIVINMFGGTMLTFARHIEKALRLGGNQSTYRDHGGVIWGHVHGVRK